MSVGCSAGGYFFKEGSFKSENEMNARYAEIIFQFFCEQVKMCLLISVL